MYMPHQISNMKSHDSALASVADPTTWFQKSC